MRVPARGRAGGKVILLGEHAVVYGRPAVASGIPLGLTVEVTAGRGPALRADAPFLADDPRLPALLARAAEAVGLDPAEVVGTVESELPPGRGLGSSAALAVATLRACAAAAGRVLGRDDELALGRRLEALFHGTPSGIDPAAAALGGCFRFVCGEPPQVTPLAIARPLPLVVAFGDAPRSTAAAVAGLRARWDAERDAVETLLDATAAVAEAGAAAAVSGDLDALGAAMDENQRLLAALGVSSPEVEALVAEARRAGALGAKLTGGGAGGAVIALARDPEPVAAALRRGGSRALVIAVGAVGEGGS